MIVVDANLLLYAYDAAAREHPSARSWLESTFSSAPAVGLPETAETVAAWLERDNVSLLAPGPRHWEIFLGLLADSKSAGPRTTDAHIAALTIEHGGILYTNEVDFRRFRGLDVRFPLHADR